MHRPWTGPFAQKEAESLWIAVRVRHSILDEAVSHILQRAVHIAHLSRVPQGREACISLPRLIEAVRSHDRMHDPRWIILGLGGCGGKGLNRMYRWRSLE